VEQHSAPLPFPTDANPKVDPVRRLAGEVLADVLTRLAVVWMRGRRLTATATPAAAAAVPAGAGA
jgi:hypothetical protein